MQVSIPSFLFVKKYFLNTNGLFQEGYRKRYNSQKCWPECKSLFHPFCLKKNVPNTNGLFQGYRNRYKFYSTYNLRLHMPPVQFLLAISLPWQYRPPLDGLGLLQSLRLNCRQSGLQEDQEDHELQVPSTASQN